MKKTLLILTSVLFCVITFAQTVPQGVNYQAIARDASGVELVNQALNIQISVISGSSTGSVSWQETHSVITNNFGLFTTIIGQGISTGIGSSATFDAVDWGSASHYIKVELDAGGGLVDMGTTELMSVPYALSSGSNANALWSDDGSGNISNTNSGDVQIGGTYDGLNIEMNPSGDAEDINMTADEITIHGHMETRIESDEEVRIQVMGMGMPGSGIQMDVMMGDIEMNADNVDIDAYNVDIDAYGGVDINGDVSGSNAPTMAEHLTRKDYVDAADAALLDSLSALDSVVTANALWSDDGSGNITNSNSGNTNIGDGIMGVNINQYGDQVDIDAMDVEIQAMDVEIGDGMTGIRYQWGTTHIGSGGMFGVHVNPMGATNIGDGYMGINVSPYGDLVDINATQTNINGDVNISGNLYAGGTFLASDRRFKKDINTVENALDKVLKLRGVNYYWKKMDFPNKKFDDKLELGLIAQEVELVIPEIVGESADGYKAVEYQKLVALLIEAIKEQQTIIDGQKTEMADMLAELDGRLKSLEELLNTTTLNK
ncbi:MAG: tail fiber domain-containing protein [Candidatus Marinimicrobia bacterium]|nr:tail fiber domain-containing protein [Candidatus Neomarinimicrobiota bacterium]